MVVNRFDVYLVNLDPTIGHEIKKTRPALIDSPDEMNRQLETVVIAPMTTKGLLYPTRVTCTFMGKKGQIVGDQIKAVDKSRLIKKLGKINISVGNKILDVFQEMFKI